MLLSKPGVSMLSTPKDAMPRSRLVKSIIAGVSTHVINVDRASNAAVEIVNVDIGIDARLLIKATAHKQVQIIIFIPGAIHEGEYARFRRNERAPRIAKRHPIVPETRATR